MPMNLRNLAVLGYCNGFTLWNYKCSEPYQNLSNPVYWESAYGMLNKGDHIHVNCANADGILAVLDAKGVMGWLGLVVHPTPTK